MVRARRLLPVLTIAVALLAAGCGVDGGDQAKSVSSVTSTTRSAPAGAPSTTTTERRSTTTTEAGSSAPDTSSETVDKLVDVYTEMGFTKDEATCIAEHVTGSDALDPTDTSQMMDLINQCDISMSRLMELTDKLSGGTGDVEATMRNSLAAGFRASGLTDEQATCVADAFVDEFGTDASKAADPATLQGLFEQCDVDPNQMGN